ncbi:ferredoxin--NADP reductase [Vulgatibacter sp.]|uniref:ferredoxin--NADP reductase n=1 Tax=Vulgatibacter sp. TaxID=1971226 RepID=UPI003561DE5D
MSTPFHPARIVASWPEAPLLRGLRLQVAPGVAASYRHAGQFLKVRRPGETDGAFFAIASGPGGDTVELLVKQGEGLPDELVALPVGAEVETTLAMGSGFPLEENRGRDVLLFATGSGIAPIRAALQEILGERDRWGAVELFFGVRTPEDFPYGAELDGLAAQGVKVHRVISQQGPQAGHARYVQERFRAELPRVENAVAFLCGLQGMIDGVTEALCRCGLPAERIHLNV